MPVGLPKLTKTISLRAHRGKAIRAFYAAVIYLTFLILILGNVLIDSILTNRLHPAWFPPFLGIATLGIFFRRIYRAAFDQKVGTLILSSEGLFYTDVALKEFNVEWKKINPFKKFRVYGRSGEPTPFHYVSAVYKKPFNEGKHLVWQVTDFRLSHSFENLSWDELVDLLNEWRERYGGDEAEAG